MAGSLFERLTLGAAGAALDEDESIRRHLSRMLATRQGAVQALPDYGLPDLNDLTLSRSEVHANACKAIEFCVSEYEPRLTEAKVTVLPLSEDTPFTMRFSITALKLNEHGKAVSWSWEFSLDGDKVRERE